MKPKMDSLPPECERIRATKYLQALIWLGITKMHFQQWLKLFVVFMKPKIDSLPPEWGRIRPLPLPHTRRPAGPMCLWAGTAADPGRRSRRRWWSCRWQRGGQAWTRSCRRPGKKWNSWRNWHFCIMKRFSLYRCIQKIWTYDYQTIVCSRALIKIDHWTIKWNCRTYISPDWSCEHVAPAQD